MELEPAALCTNSSDFAGTDPALRCDLPRGHGGRWHVERGVGRWTLDDKTFQWWDPEAWAFEVDAAPTGVSG